MKTEITGTTYRAEYNGTDIGLIVVSDDGEVTLRLSHPWQTEASSVLKRLKDEGVRDLGEVVLEKPMKIPTDRVFPELWRELALRGVVLKRVSG
jgi:hypothetical protein